MVTQTKVELSVLVTSNLIICRFLFLEPESHFQFTISRCLFHGLLKSI